MGDIMRTLITTAALGLSLWSGAAFAQAVEGRYRVEGRDGSNTYAGTATVSRTGETFRIQWRIGDETYNGTGIGDERFLAVSFTSAQGSGVGLWGREGEGWKGIWTWSNGRALQPEAWTRAR
jgi:hypothetical protein